MHFLCASAVRWDNYNYCTVTTNNYSRRANTISEINRYWARWPPWATSEICVSQLCYCSVASRSCRSCSQGAMDYRAVLRFRRTEIVFAMTCFHSTAVRCPRLVMVATWFFQTSSTTEAPTQQDSRTRVSRRFVILLNFMTKGIKLELLSCRSCQTVFFFSFCLCT